MRVSERINTIKVETIHQSLASGNRCIMFWSIPLVNRMKLATLSADPMVWHDIGKSSPEFHSLGKRKPLEIQFPISLCKLTKSPAGL